MNWWSTFIYRQIMRILFIPWRWTWSERTNMVYHKIEKCSVDIWSRYCQKDDIIVLSIYHYRSCRKAFRLSIVVDLSVYLHLLNFVDTLLALRLFFIFYKFFEYGRLFFIIHNKRKRYILSLQYSVVFF